MGFLEKLLSVFGGDSDEKESVTAPNSAEIALSETVTLTSDEELVAVITAAIAVMTDKPTTSFRVVSFRRTASKQL